MNGRIAFFLRVAISASVLAVILSRIPLDEVLARAAGGAAGYLAAALALSLLGIVLVAFRWRLLAGGLGLAMSAGLAVRALFLAVFGGQLLPSGIGTDILRGWLLARHVRGISRIVASLLADRLVALFAACLLVLVSYGLLGAAAVAASGGVLLAFVLGLRRAMDGVTLRPAVLLAATALALVVHAGTVGMAALIARAYGIEASLALWFSIIPLSVITSAVPVSLNGWGVREATIVLLGVRMGLPAGEALLVSVTLGVLNIVASLPGAVVILQERRARLGMIPPPPQQ